MTSTLSRLVGRERETAALDDALGRAWSGAAVAVEVVGDAGIGKTRLLSELARRADRAGALVLQGTASELEVDLPFAVFVDALDEFVRGLGSGVVESLPLQVRAELAGVLPSLSPWAEAAEVGLQHERYRSHRAIADLLETIAARQTLVLVLDDIHWSDWASAELLMALLRRPPAANVLLVLGRRPRQTAPRLAAALDRAHRAGDLERIEPAPLTREEAGILLGDGVPPDLADAVFAECGGNPFYLTEMARSSDVATARAGGPEVLFEGVEVPAGVAAALQAELDLLDPPVRRLLEASAVVGDPFDVHLAAAVASAGPAAATSFDLLTRLGLIEPTDIPTRFRFRHPIVRRAAYNLTGAAWRISAHQRCAEVLAADKAPVTSLAVHVERSARTGDMEAVDVLRRAGDLASHRAPASAAHWYGVAVELLAADAPAETGVALLLPRAGALAAVGKYEESYGCLMSCLAAGAGGNQDLEIQLTASCAALEQLLGRHDQARARLLTASGKLPPGDSSASVAFLVELSMAAYFVLDYEGMATWAGRALQSARRLASVPLAAVAGASLTLAGALSGADRAETDCTATADLVDGASDDVLLSRLDALGYLAYAELCLERFDAAASHADRVVRVARSTGQGQLLPLAVPIQAAVHHLHGNLAVALQLIDGAVEAARLTAYNRAVVWTLANRSAIRLSCGDVSGALADARESAEELRSLDEVLVRGWTGVRLGAALLATGQPAKAVTVLEEMGGGRELANVQGGERVIALELLTRCLLATDEPTEARSAAERATARAVRFAHPIATSYAERAVAAVELARGEPERAAATARRAAAAASEVEAPIEAACCRTLLGKALAAAGRRDDAARELGDAAATLNSFGALRLRDAAEQELRRCGHIVHRRSDPSGIGLGLPALTGRERQIAELVTAGRTNAAIASELFLSPKTVESHLRTVFRKLNVTSRAEVARQVARSGSGESLADR